MMRSFVSYWKVGKGLWLRDGLGVPEAEIGVLGKFSRLRDLMSSRDGGMAPTCPHSLLCRPARRAQLLESLSTLTCPTEEVTLQLHELGPDSLWRTQHFPGWQWGGSPPTSEGGKTCLLLMALPLRSAVTLGGSLGLFSHLSNRGICDGQKVMSRAE